MLVDGNSSVGIVHSIWFLSSGISLCISSPGISGAIDVLTGLFCGFFCSSCLYYHSKFSCQNPELLFTPGLTWLWILVAHEVGINEGKLSSEVPLFDAKSWVLVVSRGLGQDDHGVEGLEFSGSVINKAATYSSVCPLLRRKSHLCSTKPALIKPSLFRKGTPSLTTTSS